MEAVFAVVALVAGIGWLGALHRIEVWRRRYRATADELWRWRYGVLDPAGDDLSG